MRDFAPVDVPPPVPEDGLRQSLLATFDVCPRSAYLSLIHADGPREHRQDRGTAFHLMAERATREMVQQGESKYPPELARDLMAEILAEPGLVVPTSEHDSLRAAAWRWAEHTTIHPQRVIGVERQAAVKIGDYLCTGTIDLALRGAEVHDYKTRISLPSHEDFAKGFQGHMYGLLMLEGHWTDTGELVRDQDPQQGVTVRQVYPRININGEMAYREVDLDLGDLVDFKVSLQGLLKRFASSVETGDWPAVSGDHCSLCVARHECPIPEQFRAIDSIDSPEEAAAAAERWDHLGAEANRLKGSIRAFAEANELASVPIGSDLELAFVASSTETVTDKPGLKAAIAEQGESSKFFSTRTSTSFRKRKVKT